MMEISEEIKDKVNLVVDYLTSYDNKDNLSWTAVYKEATKKLKIDNDQSILLYTVKELTSRGYDIVGDPFKLEKYR